MIPLCIPDLTGNEARNLQACIDTTFVSSVGPFVDQLETAVAQASESIGAVATSAGTTGLHAALAALGVQCDDLVILPTFTFIASANAISHCGATPWLLDVDALSWTLDPVQLDEALKSETKRTTKGLIHKATGKRVAAIMAVYTLGQPADMDAITAIAHDYELPVVADAAAALGATYKGRAVGDLGADLTVFSFNGNKTVTAGGGGAVAGKDEALLARVKHLTTTARVSADYTHDEVGFNYRMTNLQAAVGVAQMERLDDFVAAKRRIRNTYDAAFADVPGLDTFPRPEWAESADWFSGGVVDGPNTETLRATLREAGIDARPFWKPIHLQPPYMDAPKTLNGTSNSLWQRVLTLPCSTNLSTEDQDTVIKAVIEALSETMSETMS